jgi:hypothetical protein
MVLLNPEHERDSRKERVIVESETATHESETVAAPATPPQHRIALAARTEVVTSNSASHKHTAQVSHRVQRCVTVQG